MNDESSVNSKVLSVSVAAYNTEDTIRKTISSLVSDCELLKHIEIIVVNDGSSDKTSVIAHEFEATYPDTVVVIDKQNGGYGSTINASLKCARGKYYRLVDGDDWINSNSLKRYIRFLQESDADMVISPYYEAREEEKLIDNHSEVSSTTTYLNTDKLNYLFFVMHEITVKTEALRKLGMSITENCFYTDTEYNIATFLCTETIARFDQPVYCYRMGSSGQSMSLNGIRKHYKDMINVSLAVIKLFQKYNFTSEDTKALIVENYVKHVILYATYGILVIQDRKQSKMELLQYEKNLKINFPEAYKLSNHRKFLYLARRLRYNPFILIRRYALSKYV